MEQRRIRLDQIHIASPCPVSWQDMTGDQFVRSCNECERKVYNLSLLRRSDAERLLTETNGELCARIFVRRDGSIMTSDCPIALAALKHRLMRRLSAIAVL